MPADAGPPGTDRVHFIAKRYDGGEGSQRLFGLTPGTKIAVELPYGDMWLRPGVRPVVLTAGGTGTSAILALLDELARTTDPREIHVFYGANSEADLACWTQVQELAAALTRAAVHALLGSPSSTWVGSRGLVTMPLSAGLAAIGDADD